jgi:alpha-glucosidase
VFQGQELGLPEVDVPVDARRDPMWARGGVSRDGVRVPIPWTGSPERAHGFSGDADGEPPWLPQPEGWGSRAVDVQESDPDSTLRLFRKAAGVRRQLLGDGRLRSTEGAEWSLTEEGLLLCRREGGVTVAVAMGGRPALLPAGEVVLASALVEDGTLPADAAAWVVLTR